MYACRFMLPDIALGSVILAIVAQSGIAGMVLRDNTSSDDA